MMTVPTDEPLVTVTSSDRLLVEPIWVKPIDDIEGPLYQKYMQENPGYSQIYTRKTVAGMLQRAAENMPAPYQLIIRASHRPIGVQLEILEMVKQEYMAKNPQVTPEAALEFARTFVSDPAVKVPPHCCGAAVDIDVLDQTTGELVDFGCPMNTDDEIAFVYSDKITPEQRTKREMLFTVMTNAGFAPFLHEWWHFSYGDQLWADFYKQETPLYGLIEPTLGS